MKTLLFLLLIGQSLFARENDGNSSDKVYTIVESAPEFVGGDSALTFFLQKNLKYPKQALKNGIEGKVVVQFIIEADGKLSNIQIFEGAGEELDNEALRIIKKMPRWKPGSQQGKNVRTMFALPVNFKLGRK